MQKKEFLFQKAEEDLDVPTSAIGLRDFLRGKVEVFGDEIYVVPCCGGFAISGRKICNPKKEKYVDITIISDKQTTKGAPNWCSLCCLF